MLWPTAIEVTGFPPTIVNPAAEIDACVMFTVAVPVLVTLRVCVAVVPTATFPKPRLVGLGVRTPTPGFPGFPPPPPLDAAVV